MNQLHNSLELQKSKQERLQSHIKSLEKQISDMVNDYESKLMSAYYGNVDDLWWELYILEISLKKTDTLLWLTNMRSIISSNED